MSEKIELPHYGKGGDGYIYGRIFKSAMNQGDWILDAADVDYAFSKIEVLDVDDFVLHSKEALDRKSRLDFYGGYARVNENDPMLKVVSSKKPFGWLYQLKMQK